MTNTAIVIGATGLVGSSLVTQLEAADHIQKVVTITRRAIDYSSVKIVNKVVDFDCLSDHAEYLSGQILFSCLGTTVKQAGSIDAQRHVDLDYQYQAAKLASEQGVNHYFLVSSSGANSNSLSPYLKMKGELEDQVQSLKFDTTTIIQPSLLLGQRDNARFAEEIGAKLLPILCKLPGLKRYRPITGLQVAQKMVTLSQKRQQSFSRISLDAIFPD